MYNSKGANLANASISRICLVLLSHLDEPIPIKQITEEVYADARTGYRAMPNREKNKAGRKRNSGEFFKANYQEVHQCCADLKKQGLIEITKSDKDGRQSLVKLNLKGLLTKIFGPRTNKKSLVVLNKSLSPIEEWNHIIANIKSAILGTKSLMKTRSDYIAAIKKSGAREYERNIALPEKEKEMQKYAKELTQKEQRLRSMQNDLAEAKAIGKSSAFSLNDSKINFLLKRLDCTNLKREFNWLRKGGMLNYLNGNSNIIKILVAVIKRLDLPGSCYGDYHISLKLLGIDGTDTAPITENVLLSFIWKSGLPDVVEFYDKFYWKAR